MQPNTNQPQGSAIRAANTPVTAVQANPDLPIATQTTLMISEIRDSMVIMKNGSFRAVIACQSVNFDLMSDTEREATEYSFQSFLNNLKGTVQILIRSEKVDLGPYIDKLIGIRRNNDNMLLGVLMDDYINFIDILSQEANIMNKTFYIVIPYYPDKKTEELLNTAKSFFKNAKEPPVTRIDRPTYEKAVSELNNLCDNVISSIFQTGVQATRLNTKQLGQLFYNFNNPDTSVREPLVDFSKVATTFVKKGVKNNG